MRRSEGASKCCSAVDDSLGRIVAALERKGVLDDTVVVFTSDHGYFYGEHGLNEERRLAYEETIRIPLVVRYPPLAKAGSLLRRDGAEHRPGADAARGGGPSARAEIQGRSLVPVLKQEARDWRSSFLIEYFTDTVFPRIRNMGYVAVRSGRHKYINYRELKGMDELYDLETDPFEETNLIGRPEAGDTLLRMQTELRRLTRADAVPGPVTRSPRAIRTSHSHSASCRVSAERYPTTRRCDPARSGRCGPAPRRGRRDSCARARARTPDRPPRAGA